MEKKRKEKEDEQSAKKKAEPRIFFINGFSGDLISGYLRNVCGLEKMILSLRERI